MKNFEALDDAALLKSVGKNPDAFAVLYRRYLTPVYRYIYHRLGNVQDTEDLAAQVFTAALEGITAGRYRESGSFAAWLFTIARRRLVDHFRRHPEAELDDPPAPDPGILSGVEMGEDLNRLAALFARLDETQQDLLRLRFSAGLSFAQIGQIEGRSEAAVKMAIYRILEMIRNQWQVQDA